MPNLSLMRRARRTISLPLACLLSTACASVYDHMGADAGSDQRPDAPPLTEEAQPRTDAPIGWASVNALGQDGTTGGGSADPVVVKTLEEFAAAAAGDAPSVIQLGASMEGKVKIGSNKTVSALPGVVFTGHLGVDGSANVILHDLTIVGYNCTDNPDCQSGADAMTISNGAHHVWIDHCDISDGSDGNLDITSASDYVTVSWTKFSYSGRLGGHEFSNLIGSSDQSTGDEGHLRVTWHHVWWATGVLERMPRVRYGEVHLFNNLYSATGDSYCVGVGWSANILLEDNLFSGVKNPLNFSFKNDQSIAVSYGNVYEGGSLPPANLGVDAFVPPYDYALQPADAVRETVMANAGPSIQ